MHESISLGLIERRMKNSFAASKEYPLARAEADQSEVLGDRPRECALASDVTLISREPRSYDDHNRARKIPRGE